MSVPVFASMEHLLVSVLFSYCRRTSSAAVKETSMTDLENMAECSGAQAAPAETDKPEVNLQT